MIPFASPPPPITRDGAREAAHHELSKAIYHRYDEPLPTRLLKDFLHWLNHLLGTAAEHSPGGRIGAVVLVLLAAALVAFARWRVGPLRRSARQPHAVLGDLATRAADHRRLAETAAAAGRWSDAVIERMRGLARELEEQAILDARAGRTADELAAEATAELPFAAEPLATAARIFDGVAYGRRGADAGDYAALVSADRTVTERRLTVTAP